MEEMSIQQNGRKMRRNQWWKKWSNKKRRNHMNLIKRMKRKLKMNI